MPFAKLTRGEKAARLGYKARSVVRWRARCENRNRGRGIPQQPRGKLCAPLPTRIFPEQPTLTPNAREREQTNQPRAKFGRGHLAAECHRWFSVSSKIASAAWRSCSAKKEKMRRIARGFIPRLNKNSCTSPARRASQQHNNPMSGDNHYESCLPAASMRDVSRQSRGQPDKLY